MRVTALVILLVVATGGRAHAYEELQGTRALGMGGATRAWALGDSGPLLNPSGMSLAKVYSVEAAYEYASRLSGHFFHASVVDSTSAADIGGGLYYTYHNGSPGISAAGRGHGHEVGGALSLPLGNSLAVGATAKWFELSGSDQGPRPSGGGLTFDTGVTVRPTRNISLAVVGSNLRDLGTGQAPRGLSYGVAFLPMPELVLALDGVTTFTREDTTGLKGTGVQGGMEWTIAPSVAVRAGGGTDPMLGVGYLSGGVSAVSDMAALDFGVRGDLFPRAAGSARNLFLGVSVRVFIPGLPGSPGSPGQPGSPEGSDTPSPSL
jgi:hypothetical protein